MSVPTPSPSTDADLYRAWQLARMAAADFAVPHGARLLADVCAQCSSETIAVDTAALADLLQQLCDDSESHRGAFRYLVDTLHRHPVAERFPGVLS